MAAILFPVFARAREKARQSNCLSNHKQFMLVALQYTQDYDEKFPHCYSVAIPGYDDGISKEGFTTDSTILPYMKNTQVMLCPSVDNHRTCTNWYQSGVTSTTDYGWNCIALWGDFHTLAYDGDASRAVVMTEIKDTGHRYVYFPWLIDSDDGLWKHNDGQNVGFMDGHAKWFSKQTFDGGFTNDGLLRN
ncbi:MAG: hypothetical protein ACLFWB_07135 [Armatimonadota bacterium]